MFCRYLFLVLVVKESIVINCIIAEFHGSQTEVESQAETVKGIADENEGKLKAAFILNHLTIYLINIYLYLFTLHTGILIRLPLSIISCKARNQYLNNNFQFHRH